MLLYIYINIYVKVLGYGVNLYILVINKFSYYPVKMIPIYNK